LNKPFVYSSTFHKRTWCSAAYSCVLPSTLYNIIIPMSRLFRYNGKKWNLLQSV